MNWASRHTSDFPTASAMLSPTRDLYALNSTHISGGLTWKMAKRKVYVKSLIVPPVSGKRGLLQKNIVPLWTRAAKSLQEANRVVIAGYSCPPLDFEARILLSENLSSNNEKRVYVIDPNPETVAKFMGLCGVDHITTYNSLDAWVRDAKKYS